MTLSPSHRLCSVFIPAAGLGERLRPITDHIPKPLLPILGRPQLGHLLERVSTLNPHIIAINLHYKADQIKDYLDPSPFRERIRLFFEDPILGTGGALKNAGALLTEGTFLVHNSDIISDIDLEALLEFHLISGNKVTLAVHDHPQYNNLLVDDKGLFIGIKTSSESEYAKAFTGIAVYEPEFLQFIPQGVSSVVDAWLKAAKAGYKIGTADFTGCYWNDIGTPGTYASAIIHALKEEGEYIFIDPSVKACHDIELNGYISIAHGCIIGPGLSLRNCFILPGSNLRSCIRKNYENCIIGPDFELSLREEEILGSEDGLLPIGTGGSDRRYYRKRSGERNQTVVITRYPENDPDFGRHTEYTIFFRNKGIPVPELYHLEPDKKTAIFEDLGDLSLYSWLKCSRDRWEIEEMYRRVIEIMISIHKIPLSDLRECPLLEDRVFDYEHLRWETSYFVERFIRPFMGLEADISGLNEEFHRLAQEVDRYRKTVIHRDLQSQNIMITKGVPRVIDYQGARIGPPAYDIASLLWDPYFRLDDDTRERLLHHYIEEMNNDLNAEEILKSLIPCRLQRHMQALGAYGFLSVVRGKRYFLKFVPEALRLLKEDILPVRSHYPELSKLIEKL